MSVTNEERYSRQIRFAGIGAEGQRRLAEACVAVVGCGALGSVQAELLARAGVGRLRLIDRDFVEWSNLQRQLLYDEHDAEAALPKAVAAAARLQAINSAMAIEPMVGDLTSKVIEEQLEGVQLILDGTDNFETRYLLNDYALSRNIPWIYCAAVGSYGLKMPIVPGRTCCLRCLLPEPPRGAQATCETAGVLAPITATIAALAVADALLILSGHEVELARNITMIDVWSGELQQMPQPEPRADCPACVRREFAYLDGRTRAPISLCGRNAVQIHDCHRRIDLAELAARLQPLAPVKVSAFALRAQIEGYDLTVFPDGRAIVKGTQDVGVARSLYAKYVGS